MNKAKIKLELDLDTVLGRNVFASLSSALAGTSQDVQLKGKPVIEFKAETVVEEKLETEVEKPKRAPRAKTAPAAQLGEATAEEPAVEQTETAVEESTEAQSDVTLEMVKAEIGFKVGKNREAIKAKLTEFGVDNSSKLLPHQLSTMFEFLKTLS